MLPAARAIDGRRPATGGVAISVHSSGPARVRGRSVRADESSETTREVGAVVARPTATSAGVGSGRLKKGPSASLAPSAACSPYRQYATGTALSTPRVRLSGAASHGPLSRLRVLAVPARLAVSPLSPSRRPRPSPG